MHKRTLIALALSAAATLLAAPASAVVCYTLLDSSDSVLYRGYEPPVDMSAAGAAAREALRQKKQFMMISYVDDCLLVSTSRWEGGTTASVEEIVSGIRPFASGAPSGPPTSVSGATQAARPPAPPAPAARSGSTGQRGY